MALIPPFFMDCVVAIGTLNDKNETVWVGTGFLYAKLETPVQGEKKYWVYLVSNRHVLKDLKIAILRFNPQTNQPAKDFQEPLTDINGNPTWTGHPDPNVDIAVLSVNVEILNKEGLKYGVFKSDEHSYTISDMEKIEVSEGDFLYALGFPMGLVAKDRKHVILRQGVIARIRDLFEKRSKDFVVDCLVYPGNSGGPVVLKPEMVSIEGTKSNSNAALIGVIKSYLPYQDVAISQQTQRPRIIFEENSGLSLVEPVDHIHEAIDSDLARKKK